MIAIENDQLEHCRAYTEQDMVHLGDDYTAVCKFISSL